jgi:hypothetical protein
MLKCGIFYIFRTYAGVNPFSYGDAARTGDSKLKIKSYQTPRTVVAQIQFQVQNSDSFEAGR